MSMINSCFFHFLEGIMAKCGEIIKYVIMYNYIEIFTTYVMNAPYYGCVDDIVS